MKKNEKAAYDAFVSRARSASLARFVSEGWSASDAEDMAQDVALELIALRVPVSRIDKPEDELINAFALNVSRAARRRLRGARLMDIEAAIAVPDVSTPDHFLMAQEIAGAAIALDLDSVLMGDTLADEAEHYGVSRQRAHQIVNGLRDQMSEYLLQ